MDSMETIAQTINVRRPVNKPPNFFRVYPLHFDRYIGTDVHVLELGAYKGGSLELWRDYFGPNCKVMGVDISDTARSVEDDQITLYVGDVNLPEVLDDLKATMPRVDILIDDCSHVMGQQIQSFEQLYPHVQPNGIYVCEDVYTSYWPAYGGGQDQPFTFMALAKKLIDSLNVTQDMNPEQAVLDFTFSLQGIHFYPGLVVFEKEQKTWHDLKLGRG